MDLEPVDLDFWRDETVFTAWQAAFVMCNVEPLDEPISSNVKLPEQVERMRTALLVNIAHYETGQVFAKSGWSCKTQRPAQLSGNYFSREGLTNWARGHFSDNELPLFLTK
jgi:hypothetical protein